MKLLKESCEPAGAPPAREPVDAAALHKLLRHLQLHFAHVTEHVQEAVKRNFSVAEQACAARCSSSVPLSEQAKTLQATIRKLVRPHTGPSAVRIAAGLR